MYYWSVGASIGGSGAAPGAQAESPAAMLSQQARCWAARPSVGATCSLQSQRGPQGRGAPAAASAQSRGLSQLSPRSLGGVPETDDQLRSQQQAAQPPQQPAVPAAAAAAAAAAGVVAVAFDVFGGPASLHLLQPLDVAAHAWVTAHLTDAAQQNLVFGTLVSDAGIVAGLAAWAAVTFAALQAQPPQPRLLASLGVCWGAYVLAGGSIRHGDTPLVGALKEAFHRVRPCGCKHTWAFPSGHTTAATFLSGVALFVLLPAALAALADLERRQQGQQQEQQGQEQQQRAADLSRRQAGPVNLLNAAARSAAEWAVARRWLLWGGAVAVTGAGRVLADVHWVSDVMAGALLGAGLTAATAHVCSSLPAGGAHGEER